MALLGKKTVDQIVATLDKAQRDLRALADTLTAEAGVKRQRAADITAEANASQAEAERAKRVAERVSALVA